MKLKIFSPSILSFIEQDNNYYFKENKILCIRNPYKKFTRVKNDKF